MPSREDRVEAVARRYVEMGAYSCVEWLVLLNGHEWLRGAVGLADPLKAAPLPEKPIYRLYSMTKPVISAIALMLVEEGSLRLYDPVAAFIPDFAHMEIAEPDGSVRPARQAMLIEHLLTHRSGLSYGFLRDCPVAARYRETDLTHSAGPLKDMVATIAALPLAFEPGTQWRYSVSTDVLAHIVEIVEGKPLPQIVSERIAGPLALADTGFMVPREARARLMPMFGKAELNELFDYPEGPQPLVHADVNDHYPVDDPGFARGGYGLYSTTDDYAAIADFLATGTSRDGNLLLSRHMTAMMWTNRIPENQMPLAVGPLALPGYGFSLAGRVMIDPSSAVSLTGMGEFGWSGAAGTFFWVDPKENLIGIVMTQYLGSKHPLADDMRSAVYQAME